MRFCFNSTVRAWSNFIFFIRLKKKTSEKFKMKYEQLQTFSVRQISGPSCSLMHVFKRSRKPENLESYLLSFLQLRFSYGDRQKWVEVWMCPKTQILIIRVHVRDSKKCQKDSKEIKMNNLRSKDIRLRGVRMIQSEVPPIWVFLT